MALRTVKWYKADIEKKMNALNIYKAEYDHAVKLLAQALFDYWTVRQRFESEGSKVLILKVGAGKVVNSVKNPLYSAMDDIRKDILAYSKELGLTPASLKRINDAPGGATTNSLSSILQKLDGGK